MKPNHTEKKSRMRQALPIGLAALLISICAAPGFAQQNRTFVSGSGTDTNNTTCARTAPCRSFTQAIGVTNAGGEITVLDSAGYGPFTIGKAITVTAIGVEAAITSTMTDGITVSAGASDVVTLRGLTITQTSSFIGLNGITFASGGTLNLQHCVVRGFANDGLPLAPGAATINVSDTIVSKSGSSGIALLESGSAVTASFERVQSLNNTTGFFIASNGPAITAIVANSVASGNSYGVFQIGAGAVMVVNSAIYKNQNGLHVDGAANIANSRIYGNSGAGFQNGGTIKTFGNNYLANNGSNTGNLTPIAQQ
jgi:hypothetical protein